MKDKLVQEFNYERGPVKIRVRQISEDGNTDPNNFTKGRFDIATAGGTPAEQEQAAADILQCLIETFQEIYKVPVKVEIAGVRGC